MCFDDATTTLTCPVCDRARPHDDATCLRYLRGDMESREALGLAHEDLVLRLIARLVPVDGRQAAIVAASDLWLEERNLRAKLEAALAFIAEHHGSDSDGIDEPDA